MLENYTYNPVIAILFCYRLTPNLNQFVKIFLKYPIVDLLASADGHSGLT